MGCADSDRLTCNGCSLIEWSAAGDRSEKLGSSDDGSIDDVSDIELDLEVSSDSDVDAEECGHGEKSPPTPPSNASADESSQSSGTSSSDSASSGTDTSSSGSDGDDAHEGEEGEEEEEREEDQEVDEFLDDRLQLRIEGTKLVVSYEGEYCGFVTPHIRQPNCYAACRRKGCCGARKTRVVHNEGTKPKAGQGRPLGYLCAWLAAAKHPLVICGDIEHSKYIPSYEERVFVRHLIMELPGGYEFAEMERDEDK